MPLMKELDLWFDHRARHLLPVEYSHVRREPAVKSGVQEELIGVAKEWDRAMVENDAEVIGLYMAEDWTIIGPDGRVGD